MLKLRNTGVTLITGVTSSSAEVVVSALYFTFYCTILFLCEALVTFCIALVTVVNF